MRLGNGIRSILVNGTLLASSNWVEMLCRFAYVFVITRFLGPDGYGIWTYATTVSVFALSVFSFGLESVVHYAYGSGQAAGDKLTRGALAFRIATLLVGVPAVIVWSLLTVADQESRVALLFITPAILGRGLAQLVRSVYLAREDVRRNMPYVMAFRVFELASGTVLVLLGFDVITLLLLYTATWCAEAFVALRRLAKHYGLAPYIPDRAIALEVFRRSLPMAGLVASNIYIVSGPILHFKAQSEDFSQLGQLGLAIQMATLVSMSVEAFLAAAVPTLIKSDAQGDSRVAIYGPFVALLSLGLFTTLAGVLAYAGPTLIQFVFGPSFSAAGHLLGAAVFVAGLAILPMGYLQLLVVRGQYWSCVLANAVGCITMILGFALLGSGVPATAALLIAGLAWTARAAVIFLIAFLLGDNGKAVGNV
ncbi:lipopolysaccharide biosynthesis protein [Halovulum sp. GXIMD14794]